VSLLAEEKSIMALELTPSEIEQFKDALVKAFNRGTLEQLVLFRLGEHLDDIVERGPLGKMVTDLIVWANAQGKADTLLREARDMNRGNPYLQQFEAQIQARLAPQPPAAPTALTPTLRTQLITLLLRIDITDSYTGRSGLLSTISGSSSLSRDEHIRQRDLELIIDQLNQRGQLSTGAWPLLLLIANAQSYVEGYAIEDDLQAVWQALAQTYQEV
jgi:hypothetical protein